MISEEFNDFVRQKPFRPYRIRLTDGRSYDVAHPDLATVGLSSLILAQKGEKEGELRETLISLMQVVQVEFIDSLTSSA